MMDFLRSPDLRDSLTQGVGILLGLNLGLIALMVFFGRAPGRNRWIARAIAGRGGITLLLLIAVGLIFRVVVLPLGRHVFDGHEADYFDAFRQMPLPEAMGYRFYPALAALYRFLGSILGGGEGALLLVSLAVGLVTLPLTFLLFSRLSGRQEVGMMAAFLLALDPIHAFWSSSAYNVMLPFACLLMGALAMDEGRRRLSPLFGAGVLWVALAFSFRMESAMVLLPLGVMALLEIKDLRSLGRLTLYSLPGLLLIALHALAMGLAVKRPAGADSPFDYAALYFGLQWDYLTLLRPYDQPILLVLIALALSLALWLGPKERRFAIVLLLGWLPLHLAYAAFDDYGTRHTLWMRLAPIGALSFAMGHLSDIWPKGKCYPKLLGFALILGLSAPVIEDTRRRYYATPQDFLEGEAAFQDAEHILIEPLASRCVFVSESAFYASYPNASHFELLDPTRLDALKSKGDGCVLYVYDLENYQLSSRSILERALKVKAFMDLELKGKRLRPDLEDYALIYEVKGPAK